MKKVLQWIGITIGAVAGYLLVRYGLPLLFALALIFGLDDALKSTSEETLGKLELTHIVQHHPVTDLTIDGVLTAFPIYRYDYGDKDIHAALMAHFTTADDWHIGALTSGIFAAQLEKIHPEAAFLLPDEDVIFDAWYTGEDALAYFDQDSHLFIYVDKTAFLTPGKFKMDGFTVPHDGYLYELETHSGFFGDGETYRACIVPEAARPALEATFSAHADWHKSPITRAEYIRLHRYEFWGAPDIFPTEVVTFDWWCYVDTYARAHPNDVPAYLPDNSNFPAAMQAIGARPGGNWLVALYDPDTGLFIFYQYDS